MLDLLDAPAQLLARCKPARREHKPAPHIADGFEADTDEVAAFVERWSHDAPEAIQGSGGREVTKQVLLQCGDLGLTAPLAVEVLQRHWNIEKASPPWNPEELEELALGMEAVRESPIGYRHPLAQFDVVTEPVKANGKFHATPYVWRDPALIPPRPWLYGKHYIRKQVSCTLAPGGLGKSSLILSEALAMASFKPLLGIMPAQRARVWWWNGEDPQDELDRRVAAVMQRFGLTAGDIEGWFFYDTGREQPLVLAEQKREDFVIYKPITETVTAELKNKQIDVFIVDPFISSHRVRENDNPAIDAIVKEWNRIGDYANAAIELPHHTRKTGGHEITAEDGRGASSLPDAARCLRTLNKMSKEEAEKAHIAEERRGWYFRANGGKNNMASPDVAKAEWYQFVTEHLANGDDMGVAIQWKMIDVTATPEGRTAAEAMFLKFLDRPGVKVTDDSNARVNYAPRKFAKEGEAGQAMFGIKELEAAMHRLIEAGRIESVDCTYTGRKGTRLRRIGTT